MRLFSYVVRYDSGFAPNPFYGTCTLATCKPEIRAAADPGDWVVGTGSHLATRGGHLVYLMKVTETKTFSEYWEDPRFERKRPNLSGSEKQACGDNIYMPIGDGKWSQLDSYHSLEDGSINVAHVRRDTSVDRVLISNDFVYFGGSGPKIPQNFRDYNGKDVCKYGQSRKIFSDAALIDEFLTWVRSLNEWGYVSQPLLWKVRPRG